MCNRTWTMKKISMRRFFAALLWVLASNTAFAEWKGEWLYVLGDPEDHGFTLHIDSKVVRTKRIVKVAYLLDFTNQQRVKGLPVYQSLVTVAEYDCGRKMERTLENIPYSLNMAKGPKIASYPDPDASWESLGGGFGKDIWSFVCEESD